MRVYQVDAFADRPFEGNPAAVLVLPAPAHPDWMQAVAAEMNLSETAFVTKMDRGWGLRWFTPTIEVDLCGHATLAAAHVLWETGDLGGAERAVFSTKSGELAAWRAKSEIWLDFPRDEVAELEISPGLVQALGVRPLYVGRNSTDILCELDSEQSVRGLQPALTLVERLDCRCLIVTGRSARAGFDFVSRVFAPAVGVPEDPVTGSAHCCLGPYWARRLGRTSLRGRQVSSRGGTVLVEVRAERVFLGGRAVTVMVGDLVAEP